MTTTVAIVILNYRTPDLVVDCLMSLRDEASDDLKIKVYIGDADSKDGSVEKIQSFIEDQSLTWVTCYDIGKNGGFAFGNNEIVQKYVLDDPEIDYVHFLNPDTYIRPGAVRALVEHLKKSPTIGVAGSRLEDPDGSLRAYGFRFPAPWREFFRGARLGILDKLVPSAAVSIKPLTESREVDWVTGASFMMPRKVLDDVGLMDDNYFLYFEETEWMSRIKAAGYSVWHVADSHVVHLAGASTGVRTGDKEIKRLSPIWLESRRRFMLTRYGRVGGAGATILFLLGDIVYRVHRLLRGRRPENPPHMWRDYVGHMFNRPQETP